MNIKEELYYNKEDGNFYWVNPRPGRPKDRPAGTTTYQGYTIITHEGEKYQASRLAWYFMTGEWPNGLVGYKNHNPHDTSWDNLKLVTSLERLQSYRTKGELIHRKPVKAITRVRKATFSQVEVRSSVSEFLKGKVLVEGVYVGSIDNQAPMQSGVLSETSRTD